MEPLLTYRFGRVQETVRKAVSKGVRITVGYALLLLILGWSASGWPSAPCSVVVSRPVLPMARCRRAALSCWACCAPSGVRLAQKAQGISEKEARDTLTVHSPEGGDREP